MAEVVALLKTQIDPELLKKDLENKAAAEEKEKTEGIHFHCSCYIIVFIVTSCENWDVHKFKKLN